MVGAGAPQEVFGKPHNISAAVAERRQRESEDREAVVKRGEKPSLAHRALERFARRGDDGDVDGFAARGAEPA
jgi:hypothetical protein